MNNLKFLSKQLEKLAKENPKIAGIVILSLGVLIVGGNMIKNIDIN